MGDGIFSFDLFEPIQVVRIGLGMKLKDLVVNIACELSFNDISQYFSLPLKLSFNGDAGQYFFIEAMNFTDFKS